ncbi:MAG: SurA N-terminal domain-containing protein [Nitrospiria bacterium]
MRRRILKSQLIKGGLFFLFLAFTTEARSAGEKVWAEVNAVPITEEAVNTATQVYLTQIGHKRLSPTRMLELKRKMLKGLIEQELLHQEGLKREWVVSEKELETEIKRIRDRFSSEAEFLAAIEKEDLTLKDLRKGVRRFVLIRKTRESISRLSGGARQERLRRITENSAIKIHEE